MGAQYNEPVRFNNTWVDILYVDPQLGLYAMRPNLALFLTCIFLKSFFSFT